MKLSKAVWFAALYSAAIFTIPQVARADDSCSALLDDLAEWGRQDPQNHGYDVISMSVMQPESNLRFASFFKNGAISTPSPDTTSTLKYFPALSSRGRLFPARISGQITEVFSDKRFSFPAPPNSLVNNYPFDPNKSQSGTVTLTLPVTSANSIVSFGPGFEFNPQCANNFVYGFMPTNQGMRAYVLSIKKVNLPAPPR